MFKDASKNGEEPLQLPGGKAMTRKTTDRFVEIQIISKEELMKTNWMGRFTHVAVLAVMVLVLAAVPAWGASKEDKQKEVQKVSRETLARLYKAQPSAKKAVEGAAGYAVFSNFGMKILVAGGGSGSGMAVDNKTKKMTYMKMVEVQAGLGMGVKKFRVVFVFDTQKALNDFVNSGWEFGGQTTAAAKSGDQGLALSGAVSVAPGVWMYQLTDTGLAAEITGKGTKYYKDSDLN
jgi:lipid-binding SYLF domain-containing protein